MASNQVDAPTLLFSVSYSSNRAGIKVSKYQYQMSRSRRHGGCQCWMVLVMAIGSGRRDSSNGIGESDEKTLVIKW